MCVCVCVVALISTDWNIIGTHRTAGANLSNLWRRNSYICRGANWLFFSFTLVVSKNFRDEYILFEQEFSNADFYS